MLEGITAGLIVSIALFPGTVWLIKVGMSGTSKQVVAVGLSFAFSQFFWMLVAVPGLMMLCRHLAALRTGMHLFAAFVLGYLAVRFARGRRVETLKDIQELPPAGALFRSSFNRALAMPMRLPMAISVLLATGAYINHLPDWYSVPAIVLGGLIGLTCWWGLFSMLTILFVRRVPETTILKSLNRIRPFSAILFCFLSLIAMLLI